MKNKTCFVVSPIGDEGSETRRRADCVLEYIIKPSLADLGYDEPVRVDKHDKPTHITTEIVQQLISADLVIADLSGSNANVFYELGIRHAFQKPCIMLSNWEPSPPFDVGGTNIIRYVHDDPNSHRDAISRIINQVNSFKADATVSNPVTVANGFSELSKSGDEKDRLIAEMSNQISRLQEQVLVLGKSIGNLTPSRGILPIAAEVQQTPNALENTRNVGAGQPVVGNALAQSFFPKDSN